MELNMIQVDNEIIENDDLGYSEPEYKDDIVDEDDLIMGRADGDQFNITYKLGKDSFTIRIKVVYITICQFDYEDKPEYIEQTLRETLRESIDFFTEVHNYHPFSEVEEEEWFNYKIEKLSKKDYINKLCKSTICKSSRNV